MSFDCNGTKLAFMLFSLRRAREPKGIPDKLRLTRDQRNLAKGLHFMCDRNAGEDAAIRLVCHHFAGFQIVVTEVVNWLSV